MTWAYRIAKKKDEAGDTHYQLVEAYMNDAGEIWGYTGHTDVLQHIQHDKYDDDEQVRDDILSTLMLVLSDIEKDLIDIRLENLRFVEQSKTLKPDRAQIRSHWHIEPEDFCFLFAGKFAFSLRSFY